MNSVEKSLNENKHALHSLVVFRRAANTISKKEMETIRKYGLTVAQFGVLEALYNKGYLRIQVGELFSVLSQEEQVQLAEILKKFKN